MPEPFAITTRQRRLANILFTPVVAASVAAATGLGRTRVEITVPAQFEVPLWATFGPAEPVSGGVLRVAGLQTVTSMAVLQFDTMLPVFWMVSVLKQGDVAPNQATEQYTSSTDAFTLEFFDVIKIIHDKDGWHIPHYDSNDYVVTVGFGIGAGLTAWSYSIPCSPGQTLGFAAGAYRLVRSNGRDVIGEPIPESLPSWIVPVGADYRLVFDASGTGTLTTVPARQQ